jgi:hypothetical protein
MFSSHKAYRISLPEPCHENWQEMTPTEKGRFCASCQKEVIDFTQLNDAKIVAFLKQGQQGFCGRFRETQLDRKIEKQRDRFGLMYFKKAVATFLAIISLKKSYSQGEVSYNPKCDSILESNSAKVKTDLLLEKPIAEAIISGYVKDNHDQPLQNANISVSPYSMHTQTDSNGYFKIVLTNLSLVKYTIVSVAYPEKSTVTRSVFKSNFPYEMNVTLFRAAVEQRNYQGGISSSYFYEEKPTIIETVKTFIISKKKSKKHK